MACSYLAPIRRLSGSMLQQSGISNWLATSTAHGHRQIPDCAVAAVHGLAACHLRRQHTRPCRPLDAVVRQLTAAQSSTAGPLPVAACTAGQSLVSMRQPVRFATSGTCAAVQRLCCPTRDVSSSMQKRSMHTGGSGTVGLGQALLQQDVQARQPHTPAAAAGQFGADTSSGSFGPQQLQRQRPTDMNAEERLMALRERLLEEYQWDLEVDLSKLHGPSTLWRCICPECHNGSQGENSFAITVKADDSGRPYQVLWCCHRQTCGFKGQLSLFSTSVEGTQQRPMAPWQQAMLQAKQQQQQQQQQAWAPQQQQQQQPWQQQQAAPVQQWQQRVQAPQQGLQQQQPPLAFPAQQQPPVAGPRQLGQNFHELSPELLQWLKARGISRATLERNRIKMEARHCSALGARVDHIAFPYYMRGAIVNVKYRAPPKHFTQVKGGQQVFYGYDDAQGAEEVIIVEGELDKLAIEEAFMQVAASKMQASQQQQQPGAAADPAVFMALPGGGRRAVVSVPAGAVARVSGDGISYERKFKFMDACRDILTAAKRVVLAVDNDGPGSALAVELSRRIGPEKCLMVTWPTSRDTSLAPAAAAAAAAGPEAGSAAGPDTGLEAGSEADPAAAAAAGWERKDANEVLMKDGPEVLTAYIDAAKPVPVRGLYRFEDFWQQVYDLYTSGTKGLGMAYETGWPMLDKHYKVVPGELTIVTGLANSGKSEWLDALVVNLAERYGWTFGVCSLENTPVMHSTKLMEKYTRKAFFDVHGVASLEFIDVLDGIRWIDQHFHLILPPVDEMPSIDYILEKARAAVLRYGIKGLIIDPYNELNTRRGQRVFETEYVSCMLSKVKRFAQQHECHVWFVAHPRTQRGFGVGGGSAGLPAPSMYDISGSAHFINKADNGIVIHRPYTGTMAEAEGRPTHVTQVLIRKVRNKVAGSIGDVTLAYDRNTGRYTDIELA